MLVVYEHVLTFYAKGDHGRWLGLAFWTNPNEQKKGHSVCVLSQLPSLPKLPTSLPYPGSPSMHDKDLCRADNIGATSDTSSPLDQPPPFPTLPPEIHHMIIAHLDQGTLASCIRVCKTSKSFSTPFFWRVVDTSSTEKLVRFLR